MFARSPALPFGNRRQAGCVLAESLQAYARRNDVVALALPRGGVPVAFEVAAALQCALDVFVVRKLGMPGFPEYAVGAIASGGVRVMNADAESIAPAALAPVIEKEEAELARREQLYRGMREPEAIAGRVALLVDDGLATGATMRAAVRAVRLRQPAEVVVATPVGARETCESLRQEADEVICVAMPSPFRAVGLWYSDFRQVTDEEVGALLSQAWQCGPAHAC